MNQNVFGVILFSFIVGIAIFISEFFIALPTPPAVYERPVYESRTSCRKKVDTQAIPAEISSIKVWQAVLNAETGKLYTDFSVKKGNFRDESIGVALHFFVKDGRGTRYLATETVALSPEFNYDGKADHSVLSSYQWLDDLQRRDNLYVVAESSIPFQKSKNLEPKFDEANAVPVLLMKGRN